MNVPSQPPPPPPPPPPSAEAAAAATLAHHAAAQHAAAQQMGGGVTTAEKREGESAGAGGVGVGGGFDGAMNSGEGGPIRRCWDYPSLTTNDVSAIQDVANSLAEKHHVSSMPLDLRRMGFMFALAPQIALREYANSADIKSMVRPQGTHTYARLPLIDPPIRPL